MSHQRSESIHVRIVFRDGQFGQLLHRIHHQHVKFQYVAFFIVRSPDEFVADLLIQQRIENGEIADVDDPREIDESGAGRVMQDLEKSILTSGFLSLDDRLWRPASKIPSLPLALPS